MQDDLTIAGHPEIYVVGDMMSLRKLPGVAEVAMQAGHYAGRRIKRLAAGQEPGPEFRYRDLGSAAYIARGRAVVSAGRLHLSGFAGWVFWLFIHIAFLTGFRNRVGAILSWWVAFTRDIRRERAFTAREVGVLPSVYGPIGQQTDARPWLRRWPGQRTGQGQPAARVKQARTPARAGRWLLAESGPARGYLAVTALAGLAGTGLVLAQAGLLARALAGAVSGAGNHVLRDTLLVLLAVVVARTVAVLAGEVAALRGAAAVKERLRSALARQVLRLGPAWAGRQRPGEVTALATGGLDALDPYYARYLPQLGLAVVVPAAVLAAIAVQDWISALIIAVTLPLIPVFGVLIGLQTKARTRRSWQLLARLSGHFLDVVQGLPTLKLFGRTAAQERVIAEVTEEYRSSVMATLRIAFLSALVLELSASLATALVAVEVGLRLLYGHLGYPTALFVLLLTPEAYLPLRNATAQFHASADGLTAAGRAFEILDTPAPGRHGSSAGASSRPAGRLAAVPDVRTVPISLNKLTVAYPGRGEPVLAGVNLTISPGDRIVITGPNGAGKTTLLMLLLGFVTPSAGAITAGGLEITPETEDRWRAQIGWLPQHPKLFAWSVADNIALGDPGASRAAIERAARLAGAADFIAGLPGGYDTVLGERGLALSTGQRQKIALARLFLRDAPLLLLDEPAAHLDPVSAAEAGAAIADLARDRTVLMVTHGDSAPLPGARTLLVAGGSVAELAAHPVITARIGPAAASARDRELA